MIKHKEKVFMENANENKPQGPAIGIINQYIKDLSLEIPHAPEIFKKIDSEPKIKIDVNINAKEVEGNIYNVELTFRIDGDVKEEKFFILEMTYGGLVSLNVPQEHKEPVLMVEVPHLLFPYARQAITNVLFNGGLPPLMLNPIDFVAMYNAKHQAAKAEKQ